MNQHYSNPDRANDPHVLPDIETFYVSPKEATHNADWADRAMQGTVDGTCTESGWYWWSCFPGCLPDGDPNGPFDTEADALADARNE